MLWTILNLPSHLKLLNTKFQDSINLKINEVPVTTRFSSHGFYNFRQTNISRTFQGFFKAK